MEEKKLYTLLVYSENVAGILNQITAVFTRRQVNIESLNVSASSIPGVHKYTITAWILFETVFFLELGQQVKGPFYFHVYAGLLFLMIYQYT